MEVKYKLGIGQEDLKNVKLFIEKFKVKKGYLISKNTSDEIKANKSVIHIIPIWKFVKESFINKHMFRLKNPASKIFILLKLHYHNHVSTICRQARRD